MGHDVGFFLLNRLGGIRQLCGDGGINEQHTVVIAHYDVAGTDEFSTNHHGDVDLAGAVLIGAVGGGGPGVDVEVLHSRQTAPVPDGTVADDALDPAGLAVGGHQLAENGPVCEAAGINDDDITGLCQIHGSVKHQVIALRDPDGEGRAQQLSFVSNGLDGKAWADSPAEGGNQFVLDALKGEGLTPDDIEIVMYTHLHNDHAGGMLLFPNSQHLFQRDEYYNMLHPLPTQKIRRDYDPRTPGDLAQIKNVRMIDGDFDMGNGIRLFKVPGHSLGGMAIQVQTAEGKYVITGDMPHIAQSLFPQMDKMEVIGGEIVDITPAPENWGPFILNSVIYDHYACYDSFNKIMMLAEREEPKWFLTGHDMWCVNKKYFG